MSREEILAQIARLERDKAERPEHTQYINDEITVLCDRLRAQERERKPRGVV